MRPTAISISEEANEVTIGFSLSNPTHSDVTFEYSTAGSGTEPAETTDFVAVTNERFTISAGNTSGILSIPITSDQIYEGDETFEVTLSNFSGASYSGGSITITITDDDTEPTFSLPNSAVTVREGDNVSIALNLSNPHGQNLFVEYSTSKKIDNVDSSNSDTADASTDFPLRTNVSQQFDHSNDTGVIEIPIPTDAKYEEIETFTVTINNVRFGSDTGTSLSTFDTSSPIEVRVTILDSTSKPTVTVPDPDISTGEGDGSANIGLMLSHESYENVVVTYKTVIGTATSSDFTEPNSIPSNPKHGSVTISSGQSGANAGTISIPITDDSIFENTESLTVLITSITGASFASSVFDPITVNITDNDNAPAISLVGTTAREIREDAGSIEIEFSLSPATEKSTTVMYSALKDVTTDPATPDTADQDIDFTSTRSSSAMINRGSSGMISIPIINDDIHEGDETFTVSILGTSIAVKVTIEDDDNDSLPILSVINGPYSVMEGDTTINLDLVLSKPTTQKVSFDVSTENGTAIQPGDYDEEVSTPLEIVSGLTGTIPISINADAIYEGNESFNVKIENINNAMPESGNSITIPITILEDDAIPTLTAASSDIEIEEGVGGSATWAVISLSLDRLSEDPVTVFYTTSIDGGVNSAEQEDFRKPADDASVVINNSTTGSIFIQIVNDDPNTVYEGDEEFTMTITSVSGAQFASGVSSIPVTVTITEPEPKPVLSRANSNPIEVMEDAGSVTIPLAISPETAMSVSVTYSALRGDSDTATNSADFKAENDMTIEISRGTAGEINIPINDDDISEGNETFTVTISEVVGGAELVDSTNGIIIPVTILDDETLPVLSVSGTSLSENAGSTHINLSLDRESKEDVTMTFTTMLESPAGVGKAASADFVEIATATMVKINKGETTGMLPLTITQDTLYERDETFIVKVVDITNATATAGTTTDSMDIVVSILDDDPLPTLTVTNTNAEVSVSEDSGPAIISLGVGVSNQVSNAVEPITVTYTTSFDDETDSAEQDDFTKASNATATIATSGTTGEIRIPIIDDEIYEGDESFTVTIIDVTGAQFASGVSSIPVDGYHFRK